VRGGVKVAAWVGMFAVCAGAGAYVAAHTNPFPPGVEDPGSRSIAPTSASPAVVQRWTGTMRSRTEHVFHVGGSCVTWWRTGFSFDVRGDTVQGAGVARLLGDVRCDFPEAQVQSIALNLRITGTVRDGTATLRFAADGPPDPRGSRDLGGFTATVDALRPKLRLGGSPASTTVRQQRSDGDLGVYRSNSRVLVDCVRGC
jgi:hypothetical protein